MIPIINFKVLEEKGKIVEISLNENKSLKKISSKIKFTPLETQCKKQIKEYLLGKRKKFSIPIKFNGTMFQEIVWKEMKKIPYGKTISYKNLSKKIGKPKAYRAVANACGKNPLPIIIPCHRVVATNGLGGYSSGIEIKKKLLRIESK